MSTADTTSLATLPGGAAPSSDPVQLVAQDVANELKASAPVYSAAMQHTPAQAPVPVNQVELVKSLESASKRGFTGFPEQNVVHSHIPHQIDPSRQPDYMPRAPATRDYITSSEAEYSASPAAQIASAPTPGGELVDALRLPALVSACYFLFQTPQARRIIRMAFPMLISTTGGFNIQGQFVSSAMFGMFVYGGVQLLDHFSA